MKGFDGKRLRARRVALGLSIADVHERLIRRGWRISTASIYALEAGTIAEPAARTLVELAEALRVRPSYFYAAETAVAGTGAADE